MKMKLLFFECLVMIDKNTAEHNLKRLGRAWWVSWLVFLIPVITLLYKYSWLSTIQIVLLANISTLVFAVFELPTSTLADTLWRKKSLMRSAWANIWSAALIFLFPAFWSYALASVCFGFYWCFWSGTAQAFLDENLRVLWREKEFWKIIGHYNALEKAAWVIAPLVTAWILKWLWEDGYQWLAWFDLVFALVLRFCLKQLHETVFSSWFVSISDFLKQQFSTAKSALNNVRTNKTLRMYTLYRSLSNHVSYFLLLAFILMTDAWMPDRWSGFIVVWASFTMMIASKYAYLIGDKLWWWWLRVFWSSMQALLLILLWFLTQQWILIAIVYMVFEFFEWLWMPAWNHCIVEETKWVAIATTRSIIFAIFGLRTTVGKQILSMFSIEYALIGMWCFLLIVNGIFAKTISKKW